MNGVAMSTGLRLTTAWLRFADWSRTSAPVSFEELRPPASGTALREVAAAVGGELPADLDRLPSLCDGARNTVPGAFLPASTHLLSAQEIVAVYRGKRDMLDNQDLVGVRWHPRWVPFAATGDALGCYSFDDRPGPGRGSVGYFFNEAGKQSGWWPTRVAFAEAVAEAVEDTRPVRSDAPRLARPDRAAGASAGRRRDSVVAPVGTTVSAGHGPRPVAVEVRTPAILALSVLGD